MMYHDDSVRNVCAALAIAGALSLAACAQHAPVPLASNAGTLIKIGVTLPITGVDAPDGLPASEAVRLAVADANTRNLVPGMTLQAVVLNDASGKGAHDPVRGAANLRVFTQDGAVLGVIGPLNSNVALVEIPISNKAGLALISPANTTSELTKGTQALALRSAHPDQITYFRVCTTDDVQGPAGAEFAYERLKAKRAYVIDDANTFGRALSDEWVGEFNGEGGQILAHEHITFADADLAAVAARVKAKHPDLVFFGGEATGGGKLRLALVKAGLQSVPFASGDGIQTQEYFDVAGSAADNSYATVAAVNADALPSAGEFVKAYHENVHVPLGAYAANAYAATQTLISAIAAASADARGGIPTRAAVLDKLRTSTNVMTVIGKFSFDRNGDTTEHIISIYRAQAGVWHFLYQRDFAQSS
ncbi:MAG TPA: branched-chain amino acid ABC transporter substrate-binding protein [Candidatus Eremiobacteraceae bacterium]